VRTTPTQTTINDSGTDIYFLCIRVCVCVCVCVCVNSMADMDMCFWRELFVASSRVHKNCTQTSKFFKNMCAEL
jgi:hypothetical protein